MVVWDPEGGFLLILHMITSIMGDDGKPVITMGEAVNNLSILSIQVVQLSTDVASQGGVTLAVYCSRQNRPRAM